MEMETPPVHQNIVDDSWRTYSTICRLCLQKDGFMLGIFNHIHGKERSISKKIIDCTALPVHKDDGLPNVICHRCLYKIEFCLEFRQLCFISDATLRQLTQNQDKTTNNQLPPHYFEQVNEASDENLVMVVDPNAVDYDSESEEGGGDKVEEEAEAENAEGEVDGKNVSMCKFCDHAFTDAQECIEHETTAHNTEQPYNCSSCYMGFADRHLYSAHMKSVHKNDKPYNCPQCDRTFARRSDLRKHTIVHTGVKPYTCSVCYKSFSRNTNLSKHMRIHLGTKPFVCPKCPRTFTSRGDLNRHCLIHSGQKPFRCAYCGLSFGRRDKLVRHEKRHWPRQQDRDKSHELQAMRESLSMGDYGIGAKTDAVTQNGEAEVKQEENMVINLDPFNHNNFGGGDGGAGIENETTPTHNNVEDEDKESENDKDNAKDLPEVPEHIKDEVQGEYHKVPNVPEHMTADVNDDAHDEKAVSVDPRPYPCNQCPKKFSSPDNLRYHQAIHLSVRSFGCHLCNKAFIRKRELDRHLATHTGIKPFKCTKCLSSFARKDKLIRHMRIHERHDREKYEMELKDSIEAYMKNVEDKDDEQT